METWKACPISPFLDYDVSDEGRVRNRLGKILRPHINRYGYRFVILHHSPQKKMFTVHRLVASAFIGDIEGQDVHHKDGNRENNLLKNLEILPHKEHMIRQFCPPDDLTGAVVRKTRQGKPIETVIEYSPRTNKTTVKTTNRGIMRSLVGAADIVEESRTESGKLKSMVFSFSGAILKSIDK